MIDGLETADLKILDPFNEHRNDYVWLRFQACYPEIYRHVIDIQPTVFRNMFLISCKVDSGLNPDKLFMFDYDSGDIIGLVGTIDMYLSASQILSNLPRGFNFVDKEGHPKLLTALETKKELVSNTVGRLIIQIVDMYKKYSFEMEKENLNNESNRPVPERES